MWAFNVAQVLFLGTMAWVIGDRMALLLYRAPVGKAFERALDGSLARGEGLAGMRFALRVLPAKYPQFAQRALPAFMPALLDNADFSAFFGRNY